MFESRELLAWAAGILEGEGAIYSSKQGSSIIIAIAMTDQDVLEKFCKVVQLPVDIITRKRKDNYKIVYEWRTAKYEYAQAVIAMLWPWLCSRRKAQAKQCLLKAKAGRKTPGTGPGWAQTHCKNGHEWLEDNTYTDKKGCRICRICRLNSHNRNKHKYKKRTGSEAEP